MAKAVAPLELTAFFASDVIHSLDAPRCNKVFDLMITDICAYLLDGCLPKFSMGSLAKYPSSGLTMVGKGSFLS